MSCRDLAIERRTGERRRRAARGRWTDALPIEPHSIVPDKFLSDSFVGQSDSSAGPGAASLSEHHVSTCAPRSGHARSGTRFAPFLFTRPRRRERPRWHLNICSTERCAPSLSRSSAPAASVVSEKGALSCVAVPRISRDVSVQLSAVVACCWCFPARCRHSSQRRRRHRRPNIPRRPLRKRHRRNGLRSRTASTR